MMDRTTVLILIGIAAAAAVGAAGAMLVLDDDGEKTFTLVYHKNGSKVSESTVSAGAYITIAEERGGPDRFVGWNTRPDMTGTILQPGAQLKIDRNTSLYAMMASSGTFAVILPEKQEGFTITADPMMVNTGGSSIISFSLMPSHIEKDLVIAVNGNPMKPDAMKRIHLTDITEDKYVTVSGVHDRREHSISLPDTQIGYVLTSSEEKVHHGESYILEYTLLPGYRETHDFGIHVNGVDSKRPIEGVVQMCDVRDNHRITVTGVEPIRYEIYSGKNIFVTVNGAAASGATVEDVIAIRPADGYSLPASFNSQIKGQFKIEGRDYRIASDIAFPSILKITVGENTVMDGTSSKTVIVCPEDRIKVSPSPGYSLPENYADKVKGQGAKYSAAGFTFSDDTVLPSIYKVVFNGYNKVHATFFIVGGDVCPMPKTNPVRDYNRFDKWQINSKYVLGDTQIYAVWIPDEHNISFGKNIIYTINNKVFTEPGNYTITTDDTITVTAVPGYELPDGYLPIGPFIKRGEGYFITSDYIFADIYFVQYNDSLTGLSKRYFYSESEKHTIVNPRTQINPLFTFDLENTGYELSDFKGWNKDGQLYTFETVIVDRNLLFYSSWTK